MHACLLQGPSFTVDGSLVTWQKWQFRVGFNYREGLVLHQLAYNDGGKLRPVMHRASLVEMAVPYGDPRCVAHTKLVLRRDTLACTLFMCATCMQLHVHYTPCKRFTFPPRTDLMSDCNECCKDRCTDHSKCVCWWR